MSKAVEEHSSVRLANTPSDVGTLFHVSAEDQRRRQHGGTGGAILGNALDALGANRMRSFLTMLGVIIGVSAVIAIVTLTQGVNENVSQRFASLGTNTITILPGTTSSSGARNAAGSSQTLTEGDAQAITQLPHMANVSPVLNVNAQVIYGDQNWSTSVRGVYPEYQDIQNWQMAEGTWFSSETEQLGTPQAVLGDTVVQNLFTNGVTDPIGQDIRINNSIFRVVGVLQAKGTQGASNSDDVIFVPFSAAQRRLRPGQYVNQIQIQVDTIDNMDQAQLAIDTLLRTRHHLSGPDPALTQTSNTARTPALSLGGGGNGGQFRQGQGNRGGSSSTNRSTTRQQTGVAVPNDFQILNVNQLIQTAQQNSAVLTVLLIGIAAISLTVGGIGIMNIMLVSVTERTREIGVLLAVGARQRDVRNQFLLEALMLSIIGGVIGIIFGELGGFALTVGLGFPFILSMMPVVVAFSVSALIGIFFGLYPAVRASRLDPIVALQRQ
ncbi:MAG TPA: ABC transporter permease [Ktedonosporobacter sp.]|nr:ABC transporter permease [Ktedonosporobacter sp.]